VPVLKAALPIAVAAVAGLAVVGWLVPPYRRAWVLGLLLLPGCLAVSVGKAWSASLLKLRGERTTTIVAIQTLAVSVPCYFVLVPWIGATGAALASSFVYAVQAIGSRLRLRDTAVAPLSRVAV
jgi:O-antigen/teichoic acid export membrane protein